MTNSVLVWTEGKTAFLHETREVMTKFLTSLIEHYPNFGNILRESLRKIVGEGVEKRVEIGLAKDGSGVGGELYIIYFSS